MMSNELLLIDYKYFETRNLTALPMKLEILGDNATETRYIMDHPECLYHGSVNGLVDSLVALSTCNPGEIVRNYFPIQG